MFVDTWVEDFNVAFDIPLFLDFVVGGWFGFGVASRGVEDGIGMGFYD